MTFLLETIETKIAALESELKTENAKIAAAIKARQIGEHYWQKRDRIERKLIAALAVREAFAEERI